MVEDAHEAALLQAVRSGCLVCRLTPVVMFPADHISKTSRGDLLWCLTLGVQCRPNRVAACDHNVTGIGETCAANGLVEVGISKWKVHLSLKDSLKMLIQRARSDVWVLLIQEWSHEQQQMRRLLSAVLQQPMKVPC